MPAGIESLIGRRGSPSFFSDSPDGFPGSPERDRLDTWVAGWSRGALQVRFGLTSTHLETTPGAGGQSRVDLLSGVTNGVSPLASNADRTTHDLAATYTPAPLVLGASRSVLLAGIDWQRSSIRNRLTG